MEENKFFVISGVIGLLMVGFGFGIALKSFYDTPRSQDNIEACERHCEEIDMALVGITLTSTGSVRDCYCEFEDSE